MYGKKRKIRTRNKMKRKGSSIKEDKQENWWRWRRLQFHCCNKVRQTRMAVCYIPLLYVKSTAILRAQIRETAKCCVSWFVVLQGTCRMNLPSNRKSLFPTGGEMFLGVTILDAYKLHTNITDLMQDSNAQVKIRVRFIQCFIVPVLKM